MLAELLRADGAVVSAEQLLEKAWDEHADPFTNAVRVTILKLRRKLGDPPVVRDRAGRGVQDGMTMSRLDDPRRGSPLVYGGLFLARRAAAARRHVRPGAPAAQRSAVIAGTADGVGRRRRRRTGRPIGDEAVRQDAQDATPAATTAAARCSPRARSRSAVVGARRDRARLADRRAAAPAAAPGDRDRPADRRRPGPGPARADRADRARTTRSRSWPTRSTRCWTGWTRRSTASGGSSPTPRTSCGPR